MDSAAIADHLTPRPQQITLQAGHLVLRANTLPVELPAGPHHEACRTVVRAALSGAGVTLRDTEGQGDTLTIGVRSATPPLPLSDGTQEGYTLVVTPGGITAIGASPAGLLYAAQTLSQLLRLFAESGALPCMTIVDRPEFALRGLYIEGGQERFGRIVEKAYLLEQIRRLSEHKMNAMVIECYNLFPYPLFTPCRDEGTLSEEDCREILQESRRYHVTLIPSLQTLAQAYELVWMCDEGAPYREPTAPGLMCPSNPDIYPLIKGLYRDLLGWFGDTPIIGIGCSEIDMQWQERYCPRCRARIDAGETVRDLLLGHAERCIALVDELATELGRSIRPMVWADEFTMYGPGRDWVGIERIPQHTVMGYWKYWQDYAGIGGLLERGYDVFGISAMYNHTFYLADLSPEDPPKSWPAMEQTGTLNITEMLAEADRARRAWPGSEFLGVATASFSKHRLRAFDTIWYGFALNGHAAWSNPPELVSAYQGAFTRAFTRHYYDARTQEAAEVIADAYVRLDQCKSRLERANQALHDVVGVYDTQEAGYQGNTLLGAFREVCNWMEADDSQVPATIRATAIEVMAQSAEVMGSLDAQRPHVGRTDDLADLWLAAEKIAAHAERQILMIDTQADLHDAEKRPSSAALSRLLGDADRWAAHRQRTERIERRTKRLYSRGDPLGLASVLADIGHIEGHLRALVTSGGPPGVRTAKETVLEERFAALDGDVWLIHGAPEIAEGRLHTRAPGGWGNVCGIATRRAFDLSDDHRLVVEFDLTPLEMGADSQVFAAANEEGQVFYGFSFYGPHNRFGIYTQSADKLTGPWESTEPGWKPRRLSPPVECGVTYRIMAEITRGTFRVVIMEHGRSAWQPPLWDSGAAPMDRLDRVHLLFADIEPEGGAGASAWGPIEVSRQ